ncbi:MAG: sulfite exporter TauE/SafE family protein, partial [Ignavibacteria bacterium]|nr:sulfite exporter TauE/SafE family protein [Ignavibacteria bacterium]
ITLICGVGHILSSVIIGLVGIAFGLALKSVEFFESVRGEIAGWLLITFGLLYLLWGIKKAVKYKPHTHFHIHNDSSVHSHEHIHSHEHSHVHKETKDKKLTPWVLFIIFIFGPCEALIPILMYPAATASTFSLVLVTTVFGITTIATMLGIVLLSLYGLKTISFPSIERYSHAIAGFLIFACGAAIVFLGL